LDCVEQFAQAEGLMQTLECGYRNSSDRMVILRCCGPATFYLERVVFPFEMLTFTCPVGSRVEVWTYGLGGPELVETLNADDLMLMVPTPIGGRDLPYGEPPCLESR